MRQPQQPPQQQVKTTGLYLETGNIADRRDQRMMSTANETSQKTCTVKVRVSPKALKGEVVGWMDDGALKVRVVAAPEAGRANIELLRLVATELDIPVRNVLLAGGSGSTNKFLRIMGLDEDGVRRRLSRCPILKGE
jgi:uncharacterized protein YggU (UPF0235/DUF167 family)